jgi:hypothetical protein
LLFSLTFTVKISFYSLPAASNPEPKTPFQAESKSKNKDRSEKFYKAEGKAEGKVGVEKEDKNKDNNKDNLSSKCLQAYFGLY